MPLFLNDMSCNNFNSNTQPKVIFGGSLASHCHVSWPQTFEAFKNALTAVLPDNYSTFLFSDTEPAASDRDKAWIEVDETTCRPVGLKIYIDGSWVSVGARVFYGQDTSTTDGEILIESTNPVVTWPEDGQLFIVRFGRTCTGDTVATIKNGGSEFYTSVSVTKFNNLELEALDYLNGMVGILVYDSATTSLRLINPRIGGASTGGGGTSSATSGFNLSFDDDADEDGYPDGWDVYKSGASFAGAGTSAETSPAGGSFAFDPSGVHGSQCIKFTCSNGVGNGGGFIQTKGFIEITGGKIQEFSWWCKTNADAISNRVEMLWYDADQAYVSKTELWSTAATNPNGAWYQLGGIADVPSSARFCKVRLYAGVSGTAVGGSVWFDDFRFEAPTFRYELTLTRVTSAFKFKGPAGKFQVRALLTGGGGGGGGCGTGHGATVPVSAGGGGGGGTTIAYIPMFATGEFSVTIGAGGAGGDTSPSAGADGGNSTFDVKDPGGSTICLMTSDGGIKGNQTNSGVNATGGAGGGGSVTAWGVIIPGTIGYPSSSALTTGPAGFGGNSTVGAGGSPVFNDSPAESGHSYGGGGAGASTSTGSASRAAGNGANGVLILRFT